jgi:hypothetical protein
MRNHCLRYALQSTVKKCSAKEKAKKSTRYLPINRCAWPSSQMKNILKLRLPDRQTVVLSMSKRPRAAQLRCPIHLAGFDLRFPENCCSWPGTWAGQWNSFNAASIILNKSSHAKSKPDPRRVQSKAFDPSQLRKLMHHFQFSKKTDAKTCLNK